MQQKVQGMLQFRWV